MENLLLKYLYRKRFDHSLSPMSLALLAGCGGSEKTASLVEDVTPAIQNYDEENFVVYGNAVKGPLENAIVFIDYNNDGLINKFRVIKSDEAGDIAGWTEYTEPFVRTDVYGAFEIVSEIGATEKIYLSDETTQKGSEARFVTITDEKTIDRSSDQFLPDVMLTAPAGSTVITPMTTLMQIGDFTSKEIEEVFDLPHAIDMPELNQFNHYLLEDLIDKFTSELSDSLGEGEKETLITAYRNDLTENAVTIENISQQMVATIVAFSGILEEGGLKQAQSYDVALNAMAKLVEDCLNNAKTVELNNVESLTEFSTLAANTAKGFDTFDANVFDQYETALLTALLELNQELDGVTEIFSETSSRIYAKVATVRSNVQTVLDSNDGSKFDFTAEDPFRSLKLQIGQMIPIKSISGEVGQKISSPDLLILENGEKIFIWTNFDQSSINQTELVIAEADRASFITEIFSKHSASPFDAEMIYLNNDIIVHTTAFKDHLTDTIQIAIVSMKWDPYTHQFNKLDEEIIPVRTYENNFNPTVVRVGTNKIVASWTAFTPDENAHDIYAQFFSINQFTGEIIQDTVEFRLNQFALGDQTNVSLASVLDGEFTAVWSNKIPSHVDIGMDIPDGAEIYIGNFNSSGAITGEAESLNLEIFEDFSGRLQVKSGLTTLSKVDVNKVIGKLSLEQGDSVAAGTLLAFNALAEDSIGNALAADTLFTSAEFQHGFNFHQKKISVYNLEIMEEASRSANLREGLKNAFSEILSAFNEDGYLMPFSDTKSMDDDVTHIERYLDDSGTLIVKSFDGKVLQGTKLLDLPEVFAEAANVLQGQYGALEINTVTGDYVYDFNIPQVREVLHLSDGELVQENYLVKYSKDQLVSAGIGGMNYHPQIIMINDSAYVLWLNYFPEGEDAEFSKYSEYKTYAAGSQVEFSTDQYKESITVNTSISNVKETLTELQLTGVNGELKLSLIVNGKTFTYDMTLVDGTRVSERKIDPEELTINKLNDYPSTTEFYPGNYEYRASGKIDLSDLGANIGWLTTVSENQLSSKYGDLTFNPLTGDFSFQLKWGKHYDYQSGKDIFNLFANEVPVTLYDAFTLKSGMVLIEVLDDKGNEIFSSEKIIEFSISASATEIFEDALDKNAVFLGEYFSEETGDTWNVYTASNWENLSVDLPLENGKTYAIKAVLDPFGSQTSYKAVEGFWDPRSGFIPNNNLSFDGAIIAQDKVDLVGLTELSNEYDTITTYSNSDFNSDARLNIEIVSEKFVAQAISDYSHALTGHQFIGSHGAIILNKGEGEYVYTMHGNGLFEGDGNVTKKVWSYVFNFTDLIAEGEVSEDFIISISDTETQKFTSLKPILHAEIPVIGTDTWIENTDKTQLMIAAFNSDAKIMNPTVIDDDFSQFSTNFDIELITDSHLCVTWSKVDLDGSNLIKASYFDVNSDDIYSNFKENEFLVKDMGSDNISGLNISKGVDDKFSISWEAPPFLTLDDLNDLEFVYDLYDFEQVNVTKTSYFNADSDDQIIEDFEEFKMYLADTEVFVVPLENKIEQLDEEKVNEYLESLGDFIYYVDYGIDYYGLPEIF